MSKVDKKLIQELDLTIYRFSGEISPEDLYAQQADLAETKISKNIIADYSDADLNQFTPEIFRKVMSIAREDLAFRQGGFTLLVSSNELNLPLMRMYQAFTENKPGHPVTVRVFEDQPAALDWFRQHSKASE